MSEPVRIPLARPDLTEAEVEAVVAVLRGPVLALGPQTEAFEREFASFVGVKHAVTVSSGTGSCCACHTASI